MRAPFDKILTPSDIGRVFQFGPADPGFSAVAGFLADSSSYTTLSYAPSLGMGGVGGGAELSAIPTASVVTGIDITVNDLYFVVSQLPNFNGVLGPYTFVNPKLTFTILGTNASEIPEPGTITLIALGLYGIGLCRWRLAVRGT